MHKEDIKSFFLIFFILAIISGMVIFGIKIYSYIVQNENVTEILFSGNGTISPEQDRNNEIVTSPNNELLNQIQHVENQNQVTEDNLNTIQTGYYYEQLESYSKLIYDKLKSNKENMKSGTYKIDFGKSFSELLSTEGGTDLLQDYYQSAIETYLYDNPDVFYLDPTKMYLNIQTTKKIFTTTYEVYIDSGDNSNYFAEGYNSKSQIIECENKINQEVEKIIEKTSGKTIYEKIKTIHDYLVDNISYEQTVSKDNIYNMYGALVNKECVCEGYAKAFKYLMNQIGVESILVIGIATDSKGNTQNHAWNYVEIDNKWYAVDVTWDDPIIIGGGWLTKKNRYKYFLRGSETISKDHIASYTFIENGKVYKHPALSTTDY